MSSVRRLCLSLVCAAALIACGEPPDKELQEAQGAIDAARATGADQYAHDEFAAAEDALKRAHEAVAQRDYRLALNNALDARERAENAAKESSDRKASARTDAERAMIDAMTALTTAHAKLRAAEAARIPAKTLAEPRRVLGDADKDVQETRAALDKGDYLAVIDRAREMTARLQAAARTLEVAAANPPRRRR